ncbi:MAG: HAD family phosphatase, partial [Clostridia bacterium]|nr:HAD family phosphatase [Clostridia bacterium]
MNTDIKGVIFDLDGTIVDSMGMWHNLDKEFIISQGVEYKPEYSKGIAGMTLTQAAEYYIETLHLQKTVPQLLNEWNGIISEWYHNKLTIKKDIDRLIKKWSGEGKRMCVATLTEKNLAEVVLERHGLLDNMEFIMTVSEVGKSKKHPDIYLRCAQDLGFKPEECVVLEDTLHAMKSAKSAGFRVFAVDEPTAEHKEDSK